MVLISAQLLCAEHARYPAFRFADHGMYFGVGLGVVVYPLAQAWRIYRKEKQPDKQKQPALQNRQDKSHESQNNKARAQKENQSALKVPMHISSVANSKKEKGRTLRCGPNTTPAR